jgi:glycosyltransferase involved in cell wall biosynthesis
MDHLLYTRFRAMSRFVADHPDAAFDPIGTFRRFVPRLARQILRATVLQRWVFKVEAKTVERREIESARVFDTCLLLTPSDVDELRTRCPDRKIRAIKPMLFNFPCSTPRRYDGSPRFILCGSLRHPANRAAFVLFIRHGLEPALRRLPKLDIRVIGAGVDDELRAVARPFAAHVHFDGYVEDVATVFASSCALLVPLLFGYGLKIKMLAAMYYGLPIISTSCGAEGFPLKAGEEFILEDDLTRFAAWMDRLCDMEYNKCLSERASANYRRNFTKEIVYSEYDSVFAQ